MGIHTAMSRRNAPCVCDTTTNSVRVMVVIDSWLSWLKNLVKKHNFGPCSRRLDRTQDCTAIITIRESDSLSDHSAARRIDRETTPLIKPCIRWRCPISLSPCDILFNKNNFTILLLKFFAIIFLLLYCSYNHCLLNS